MPQKDELFNLIRSLTPSEKRYFRTNTFRGGDAKSNYMQLFDAMEGMEHYDEKLFKKRNTKKPFVKYLSAEKKQLREQLMKHLRAYNAKTSVDNRVCELLQDERIYADKGLYSLREKTLEKAKDLAVSHERFTYLLEVLTRELSFVTEFSTKDLNDRVQEVNDQMDAVSRDLNNHHRLLSLSKQLFSAYRQGVDIQNDVELDHLNSLLEQARTMGDKDSGPASIRINRLLAELNHALCMRDPDRAFQCSEELLNIYESNPKFLNEYRNNYKLTLSNHIGRAHSVGNDTAFQKGLGKLKHMEPTSFNEEGEIFQNTYFLEHLHLMNKGLLQEASDLVPEIEEKLAFFGEKVNTARRIAFMYNIMVMYYLMHDFKAALRWSNMLLDLKTDIREDVQTMNRILQPIIHYELEHFDIIENVTRASYRHLLKKNRLHAFERVVLNYLRTMPFSADDHEFGEKLDGFTKALGELDDSERSAGEEMDLWIHYRKNGTRMDAHFRTLVQ